MLNFKIIVRNKRYYLGQSDRSRCLRRNQRTAGQFCTFRRSAAVASFRNRDDKLATEIGLKLSESSGLLAKVRTKF